MNSGGKESSQTLLIVLYDLFYFNVEETSPYGIWKRCQKLQEERNWNIIVLCHPSECPKGNWIPYHRLVVNPDLPFKRKSDDDTMLNVRGLILNPDFNRYDYRLIAPDPMNYFKRNCLQNVENIFVGMDQLDEIFFPEAANLLLKENEKRQKSNNSSLQIIFYEFRSFNGNFAFWRRRTLRINSNLRFMSDHEVEKFKTEERKGNKKFSNVFVSIMGDEDDIAALECPSHRSFPDFVYLNAVHNEAHCEPLGTGCVKYCDDKNVLKEVQSSMDLFDHLNDDLCL
eukprot:TCONS_00045631-protein